MLFDSYFLLFVGFCHLDQIYRHGSYLSLCWFHRWRTDLKKYDHLKLYSIDVFVYQLTFSALSQSLCLRVGARCRHLGFLVYPLTSGLASPDSWNQHRLHCQTSHHSIYHYNNHFRPFYLQFLSLIWRSRCCHPGGFGFWIRCRLTFHFLLFGYENLLFLNFCRGSHFLHHFLLLHPLWYRGRESREPHFQRTYWKTSSSS